MIELSVVDSFLDFYFSRTIQNLEIRVLPSGKQLFTRDKAEALKFISQYKHTNIYYGVASRNGGGTKEHSREIFMLWADLDFKGYAGGEAEARQKLDSFELEPNIVIASGHGLHAYWLLTDPIQNAYENLKAVEATLLGITDAVKGDTQTCEIARVMRLPGSVNYKEAEPKPVLIEQWDIAHAYRFDAFPASTAVQGVIKAATGSMFEQGTRDMDLFYAACCLFRGKMPTDKIYQSLMALARSCNPPFSLKEAEQKVLSAMKQAAEEPRDFAAEVSQWCLLQDGVFRVDSIFNELAALTKEQKAECRNAIHDLKKRGIVEPEKGIGTYRLVNKAIEYIQIPNERTAPLNIKWPFYLEDYCDIFPGNIAVIAGTSNAGKSIFCINFAKKNLGKNKIRYQSSEMDGQELRMRLDGFGVDTSDLREQVEWIRRGSEWWDLILPDAINIVDFMEIYDNFYDVGKWIKLIFDRLTTGMALIALQKKDSKTDDGRGGALTREKARLYLSMNYGELKIVKAKNWHADKDPNGMKIGFEVERGVILKNTTSWRYGNDQ